MLPVLGCFTSVLGLNSGPVLTSKHLIDSHLPRGGQNKACYPYSRDGDTEKSERESDYSKAT